MKYKWTALTVTTVGATMGGIDTRIAIIGLPTIAAQLNAGAEEVVWITQAYLLSATIFLLVFGRIADIFGRVKLYNLGFIVFTVGSALCALSINPYMLIAFRLLQGTGASLLTANSAAIITDATPRNELGAMLGFNATAFRVGAMAGLTLSGLILSVVDWRGLFYVNIPIGIFGTIWAHYRLREIATTDTSRRMDWSGFILFSGGLTLLLLALTYLGYGLSASLVEGSAFLAIGLALLIVFFKYESKSKSPLLDPRLFSIKTFAMGNIAQLLLGLAWAGVILLVPLYLQLGLGYSALQAGIAALPLEICYLFSTLASGRLSDRYDPRVLSILGLAVIVTGLAIVSTFGDGVLYALVALALSLIGVGSGFFTMPMSRAIMVSVSPVRRGVASAFMNTIFNVGFTASYGLVILLITLGIPYGAFSTLLENAQALPAGSIDRLEFLTGFRITAIVLALIVVATILPTAMMGGEREEQNPSRQNLSESEP